VEPAWTVPGGRVRAQVLRNDLGRIVTVSAFGFVRALSLTRDSRSRAFGIVLVSDRCWADAVDEMDFRW